MYRPAYLSYCPTCRARVEVRRAPAIRDGPVPIPAREYHDVGNVTHMWAVEEMVVALENAAGVLTAHFLPTEACEKNIERGDESWRNGIER